MTNRFHFKIDIKASKYVAKSIDFPHILFVAETEEEALWSVKELVFRYLLENGFQFGIAKAVW